MKKFIISADISGLGNRFKNLVSMMRLSKELNRTLLLYWPKNFDCGCEFSDLFENKISQIDEKELGLIKKGDCKVCGHILNKINEKYKYLLFRTWRFVLLPGEVPENFAGVFPLKKGNNIDLEYEKIPVEIRNKLIPYIKKLEPIKPIRKIVEKYTKKYNFSKIVGLHVRRGDYQYTYDGRGNISTDDKFFKRIKEILKISPETKFFLSTDGEETEEKYIKMFGDKIIYFPKKSRKYNEKEGVQEALIDLLLLSKTSCILGTFLSSFTESAWWLGGCKAKIEIIGSGETEKIKQVMQRLPRDDDGFLTKVKKRIMREYMAWRRRHFMYK